MANELDCSIVAREFEFYLFYQVYFRTHDGWYAIKENNQTKPRLFREHISRIFQIAFFVE